MLRTRLIQIAFLALAAASLGAAGLLQRPVEDRRQELGLTIVTSDLGVAKDPKTALLQAIPGGLKAFGLTYLWIRSQELKHDGKFFDAVQQRDLICDLMPHAAGVWAYHGWDMAWNISVSTHTREERWMWVHNGIRLLRDRGLHYNPRDLIIHRELSWIFFSKMGATTDEMHRTYKLRWLELMEFVLGAPPLSDEAQVAVDAIKKIADAPKKFEQLSPEAKELARQLAALEIARGLDKPGPDPAESFLQQYNRFSGDPDLPAGPQAPAKGDERQQKIAQMMSSPELAGPRAELLAFCRRRMLEGRYRMDPKWMVALMERYGPLDWRHVMSHSIYWATMGLHLAKGLDLSSIRPALADARLEKYVKEGGELSDIHTLNTERNVLNALKSMTRAGRIRYDPRYPERQGLILIPDWRFIEPAVREYTVAGDLLLQSPHKSIGAKNALASGHLNFLTNAILLLYVAGKEEDAQHYYDNLKDSGLVDLREELYQKTLPDFVATKMSRGAAPMSTMLLAFRHGALVRAYRALAEGNTAEFAQGYAFAKRAYAAMEDVPRRVRPPVFELEVVIFLQSMLLDPRSVGMRIPLLAKSRIYNAPELPVQMRQALYPYVAQRLKEQCDREGVDFNKAFPAPPPVVMPAQQP
jgi:hypothetical protein